MPERPQQVVVNATPLIALALIDKLDLLQQLYGQVIMPPAVEAIVAAKIPLTFLRISSKLVMKEVLWCPALFCIC